MQSYKDPLVDNVLLIEDAKDPFVGQGISLHPLATTEGWSTAVLGHNVDLEEACLSPEPIPVSLSGEDKDGGADLVHGMKALTTVGISLVAQL